MNDNKSVVYTGEFEVEDAIFVLRADQLILRDGQISFAMSGHDDDGVFNIEGIAIETEKGTYEAVDIPLSYAGFSAGDHASVRFNEIRPTEKSMRCFVSGEWGQGDEIWTFSAKLERLPKAVW